MDFKAHLVEKALPRLVADGRLGEDLVILEQQVEPVGGFEQDHWMSETFRVNLQLEDTKSGVTRTERLVAKYPTGDVVWSSMDLMCRNEELMYNQVAPFFQTLWDSHSDGEEPLGLFPKCYLARGADDGSQPLVVMQDMSSSGFRLAASKSVLDGAHVFLALRRLGKLHALSYAAKVLRKSDFLSLAQQLRESQFNEKNRLLVTAFYGVTLERGLRRLAARGEGVIDPATVELLHRRFASAFDILADACSAEEPLAVITHGDFCRNNVMFKYNEETAKPEDMRLFDFQTAKYCSPAVDLSFFLFMNTTPSQRSLHWDDFFLAYYDGLTTALRRLLSSGPDMSPTMEMPSLAALRADFARHALYGYAVCSFFLPVMQGEPGEGPTNEEVGRVIRDTADPAEAGRELGRRWAAVNGEQGDDTVADLLLEFVERDLVGV